KAGAQIDVERVVRQSIGADDACQHKQGDHRDPHECQMMAHEPPHRTAVPPVSRSCVRDDGGHICCLLLTGVSPRAQLRRMRGSMVAMTMSAIRLPNTTRMAEK